MAQSVRTRVQRIPKQEQEVHVITNPSDQRESRLSRLHRFRSSKCQSVTKSSSNRSRLAAPDYEAPLTSKTLLPNSRWLIVRRNLHRIRLLGIDDYQAPLTSHTLKPNSKWIIVRNNIHKIRSWGGNDASDINEKFRDWYIFFQMRRELRHAQQYIKEIENQSNFTPVRYFYLPISETNTRRFNVSHVKPTDALYYPGLGREPIVLQSLLYYFSKECAVPYHSLFRKFLTDICSILNRERQRLDRAATFRKVALFITIIVFIIIGLMLFSLILSVLKTTSEFNKMYANDPNEKIEW